MQIAGNMAQERLIDVGSAENYRIHPQVTVALRCSHDWRMRPSHGNVGQLDQGYQTSYLYTPKTYYVANFSVLVAVIGEPFGNAARRCECFPRPLLFAPCALRQ